jgi:cytosine/adenosine deaminase-related metal-dependent hydrolase
VGKRDDLVLFEAGSTNLRPVHDLVATVVNRAEPHDVKAVLHEGRIVHGALAGGR